MEESSRNLTMLMEQLLNPFDDQQAVTDKRFKAQSSFNEQVSQDLKNLGKQIELMQADLDEALMAASPGAASAAAAQTAANHGFAYLHHHRN